MNKLLPVGTLVYHDGHGNGKIVAHNGVPKNTYLEQNLGTPELNAAIQAGLGEAVVNSFYSADRYPYVVKFEPSDRFPKGYQDVYDVDGVVMKVRKLVMPVFAAMKIGDGFEPTRMLEGLVIRG